MMRAVAYAATRRMKLSGGYVEPGELIPNDVQGRALQRLVRANCAMPVILVTQEEFDQYSHRDDDLAQSSAKGAEDDSAGVQSPATETGEPEGSAAPVEGVGDVGGESPRSGSGGRSGKRKDVRVNPLTEGPDDVRRKLEQE